MDFGHCRAEDVAAETAECDGGAVRSIVGLSVRNAAAASRRQQQQQQPPVHARARVDEAGDEASFGPSAAASPVRAPCRRCDGLVEKTHDLECRVLALQKDAARAGPLEAQVVQLRADNEALDTAARAARSLAGEAHGSAEVEMRRLREEVRGRSDLLASVQTRAAQLQARLQAALDEREAEGAVEARLLSLEKRQLHEAAQAAEERAAYAERRRAAAEAEAASFHGLMQREQARAEALRADVARLREAHGFVAGERDELRVLLARDAEALQVRMREKAEEEAGRRAAEDEVERLRALSDMRLKEVHHLRGELVAPEEPAAVRRAADEYARMATSAGAPAQPRRMLRDEPNRGRNCERRGFGSSAVQRPGEVGTCAGSVPTRGGGVAVGGGGTTLRRSSSGVVRGGCDFRRSLSRSSANTRGDTRSPAGRRPGGDRAAKGGYSTLCVAAKALLASPAADNEIEPRPLKRGSSAGSRSPKPKCLVPGTGWTVKKKLLTDLSAPQSRQVLSPSNNRWTPPRKQSESYGDLGSVVCNSLY